MPVFRDTLGAYLLEDEPVTALWPHLVDIIFRDSPRQAHPERLTQPARTLYLVGMFEGEVINGGISQFFSNSAGNYAHETLEALRQIGAKLSAGLLEKSLSVFPSGIAPADRHKRCELLFAFEEREPQFLEGLAQVFYEQVDALGLQRRENLTELQLEFMRANSSESVSAETMTEDDTLRARGI
jgi:hypothetical protein